MRNSDFLTVDGGATFTQPTTNTFDGSVTTSCETNIGNVNCTFAPEEDISFDNTLRVYSLNAAYNNVTFNGTTTQPLTAGNWTDVVTSGGGTISKDSPLVMLEVSMVVQLSGLPLRLTARSSPTHSSGALRFTPAMQQPLTGIQPALMDSQRLILVDLVANRCLMATQQARAVLMDSQIVKAGLQSSAQTLLSMSPVCVLLPIVLLPVLSSQSLLMVTTLLLSTR